MVIAIIQSKSMPSIHRHQQLPQSVSRYDNRGINCYIFYYENVSSERDNCSQNQQSSYLQKMICSQHR